MFASSRRVLAATAFCFGVAFSLCFTLGLGCVPADNLRVELFYTFGARSTSTRETVFTAEKFKLGDFARVQITYKF